MVKIKKKYVSPEFRMFEVKTGNQILTGSTSGGHHDAPDDDKPLGAKRNIFFEEEELPSSSDKNMWTD